MKVHSRKTQRYCGFGIKRIDVVGLKIVAIRLGYFIVQLTRGKLYPEVEESIRRGMREAQTGEVISWDKVKVSLKL